MVLVKLGRKPKDPSAWWSYKYPEANSMTSAEKAEIMCENNCTWGQNCSALRKAWLGIKIARRENDVDMLEHYANLITEIQRSMGIRETRFDDIPTD